MVSGSRSPSLWKGFMEPIPAGNGARRGSIPRDAYVIVIGAMKSGTSTFFRHLTSHPHVAASRVKEPEYFSQFQGHGLAVEVYEDLWEFDSQAHRYCAEASTGYTKYPHEPCVPDRILETGIEPRFIYVIRDPIARVESQFNHFYLRPESWAYDDFWDPGLLDPSRYHMQLQQFLLRFPDRGRYWIVDFDELIADAQSVMDRAFRWLDLEPVPVVGDRWAKTTPQPSRLELLFGNIDLSAPLKLIPGPVKTRCKDLLRARTPARRRMTDRERERARRYLRHDIVLFGKEFEFPVEKWGF